jgi:hypothetical protein
MSFEVSVLFFSMRVTAKRRSACVNHSARVILGESGMIKKPMRPQNIVMQPLEQT